MIRLGVAHPIAEVPPWELYELPVLSDPARPRFGAAVERISGQERNKRASLRYLIAATGPSINEISHLG